MSKSDCVVKGGLVVSGQGITKADVLVGDGIIQKVGENLEAPKTVDASGKYVFPGIIDAHNHPVYADRIDTLSQSAAYGGITTLIPFIGAVKAWGKTGGLLEAVRDSQALRWGR